MHDKFVTVIASRKGAELVQKTTFSAMFRYLLSKIIKDLWRM